MYYIEQKCIAIYTEKINILITENNQFRILIVFKS